MIVGRTRGTIVTMLPLAASGLLLSALWTGSPLLAAPADDTAVPVQSPAAESSGPPVLPAEPGQAVAEPEEAPAAAAEPVP